MPASGTFRHRRRRPGRRQGRGSAARAGFRRPDRTGRRGGHPPLRTAAAVQELLAGEDQPRGNLRALPGLVRRQQRRVATSHGGHRDRPGPPRSDVVRWRAPGLRPAADGHRIGPAPPAPAGADASGVLYLRRAADSDRIRDTFSTASRVLIVGAGWIGLEVAAAARAAGVDVTALEAAELPLLSVLGPQVAPVFAGLHREHGVDLRLGVRVAEITTSAARRPEHGSPTAPGSAPTR
jgi:Pyridine nucleotide-disulphide oxidoreductase